jgi:hypothetical protein
MDRQINNSSNSSKLRNSRVQIKVLNNNSNNRSHKILRINTNFTIKNNSNISNQLINSNLVDMVKWAQTTSSNQMEAKYPTANNTTNTLTPVKASEKELPVEFQSPKPFQTSKSAKDNHLNNT